MDETNDLRIYWENGKYRCSGCKAEQDSPSTDQINKFWSEFDAFVAKHEACWPKETPCT